MIHLGHFSGQKTSDIEASEQWNSKLLWRTMVVVFNVPFPYIYHFPFFLQRSVEPRHWQTTTQFNKI